MQKLNYRTQPQIDAIPNATIRAFIDADNFDFKELGWIIAENLDVGGGDALTADPLSQFAATTLVQLNGVISDATLGDAADFATAAQGALADTASQPGDNISDFVNDAGYSTGGGATATVIYDSLAVDLTDFHKDPGVTTDIPFVDAADGTYFTKTGDDFVGQQAIPHLEVDAIVVTTDSAVNNRSIYSLQITLRDSGDVEIGTWESTSVYLRDDTALYDSGSMQRTRIIRNIQSGDKLTIRVLTIDSQTSASSVCPVDGSRSKLEMVVVE